MYNQQGQNWSQPPWHPQRLAEAGVALPPGDDLVEIDHSLFEGPTDFLARGITRVAQAGDAIRIASGAST